MDISDIVRKALSKDSLPALVLGLVAGIFINLGTVVDGIDKAMVFAHLKPDALALARDDSKAQFSQALLREAWGRLFWSRRYIRTVELGLPPADREEAWRGYLTSLEGWDVDLMANILRVEQYYGQTKRDEFEALVQSLLTDADSCLSRIYNENYYKGRTDADCSAIAAQQANETNLQLARDKIDGANRVLYCFASGLDESGVRCDVLREVEALTRKN